MTTPLESKIEEILDNTNFGYLKEDTLVLESMCEIARWAVESCVPFKPNEISERVTQWNLARDYMLSKAKELGILENKE